MGVRLLCLGIVLVLLEYECKVWAAPRPPMPAIADISLKAPTHYHTAIFAGGNFWSMEKVFNAIEGVIATEVGFIGGHEEAPKRRQVASGSTGHFEAVKVIFDSQQLSYSQLLAVYWRNIDPFDPKGQFCEQGEAYRSAVFYADEVQELVVQQSVIKHISSRWPHRQYTTQILPSQTFYPAADYHQHFYQHHPKRFKFYVSGCGRESRLQTLWGDALKSDDELSGN